MTSPIKVQTKQLEGRAHYVVPMVMLVAGVACGSDGPLLYPADELQRSVPLWNGRPIVVYHPDMYSMGSAGNPEVFNRQKIGTIFNTRFESSSLKAEAWIDCERVGLVDSRVLHAIQSRTLMEVSTGLHVDKEAAGGDLNGVQFSAIARNYRPDHLAILPDQVGACSIADGAGLLRNQAMPDLLPLPAWAFAS